MTKKVKYRMNKLLYITIGLFASLMYSCSDHEEIPPEILEKIIEETILTTTIVNSISEISDSVETDVDFYSPILEKYKYTIEDLDYTIGKMVSRKSKVLSAVIQNAKSEIGHRKEHVSYIYNIQKDLGKIIKSHYQDTILLVDSLGYSIKKNSDIDKIKLNIPLNNFGNYYVEIVYESKVIANNKNYFANFQLRDSLINSRVGGERTFRYSIPSNKNDLEVTNKFSFTFDVNAENNFNYLEINLFSMSRLDSYMSQSKKDKVTKNPNLEIKEIVITREPEYMSAIYNMIKSYYGIILPQDFDPQPLEAMEVPYLGTDTLEISFLPWYKIYQYKEITDNVSPILIDSLKYEPITVSFEEDDRITTEENFAPNEE